MKKLIIISIITIASGLICFSVQAALLNTTKTTEMNGNLNAVANENGAGYSNRSVEEMVSSAIRLVTGLLGTIFIILICIAGFTWMTASGNDEKVKKSRDSIIALVIGLCLVIAAYALSAWIGALVGAITLK